MFDELNVNITQQEILKAIKELKPNRSGGPDKVINEFFIHGRDILLPHLQTLFNILLNKGYFPFTWTEGYIVPIHKKGSVNEVDNYRGITLLSTMGKLFTRILNNRLMDWAENYSVYIEAQAGFRANMGTVDNTCVPAPKCGRRPHLGAVGIAGLYIGRLRNCLPFLTSFTQCRMANLHIKCFDNNAYL